MLQPNDKLTKTEKKVFQFIRLFAQKFEYQPSNREMAEYFDFTEESISELISKISKKGTKFPCFRLNNPNAPL